MIINRRELLLGAGAIGLSAAAFMPGAHGATAKPLSVLVLGGTGFIGPHVVRTLLERGHEVILFNRGRSNTDLFPEAKRLVGDRDNGLDSLKTGQWDAVIDNSGYVPRHVKDSAALLHGRVGRYLFTSTVAVYDFENVETPYVPKSAGNPGSALAALAEPDSEDVGKYHGAFKVVCEKYVEDIYGEASTIVRPTYVAGPGDTTQCYTWWVERIHRGGDIIIPGGSGNSFGLIDVRDLAEFTVHLVETDQPGIYNASGPDGVMSYAGMLQAIRATTSSPVRFHWVDDEFLQAQGVDGGELPMWNMSRQLTGMLFENQSSIDAGMGFRTLADTAMATHEWHNSQSAENQVFTRAGLDPAKEAKVLAAWQAQS